MPDSTDIPALVEKVREAQSTLQDFGIPTAGRQRSWNYLAAAAPVLADEVERLRGALALYAGDPPLKHGMNCPQLAGEDEDCTCGLVWRIALSTEQTMHAAWRKRAEESEANISGHIAEVERLQGELAMLHRVLDRHLDARSTGESDTAVGIVHVAETNKEAR